MNSDLKLIGYRVEKLHFALNENFDASSKQKVRVQPNFHRDVHKIDASKYAVRLTVAISEEHQESDVPFFAEVRIAAKFKFENWEEADRHSIAVNNGTAILFPYLRTLLSNITMNGNVPPYTLPVMNVNNLFKEKEKDKQAE